MTARFAIELLSKAHDRSGFICGNDRIDGYFRKVVSQDVKRNYASCFVARELATDRVAGFYTLSSSNVPLTDVPEALTKQLPRYPTVPAVLIGWLARHDDFAGAGLGAALLFDAIRTVATAPIGAHAIFADAIDDRAAAFYMAFGFVPLIERTRTLYLPLSTALGLIETRQPSRRTPASPARRDRRRWLRRPTRFRGFRGGAMRRVRYHVRDESSAELGPRGG